MEEICLVSIPGGASSYVFVQYVMDDLGSMHEMTYLLSIVIDSSSWNSSRKLAVSHFFDLRLLVWVVLLQLGGLEGSCLVVF